MKKNIFLLLFVASFSVNGMSPGKSYKQHIKKLQKNKTLKGKVKIGEDLILDLSNPSEKFVFKYMDVTILKEVVKEDKGEVNFLITWPLKSIVIGNMLKKEERDGLKKEIPNEYKELKKIGKNRVVTVGTISSLRGKIILHKKGKGWSGDKIIKSQPETINSFCITHHIEEAMEINKERRERYSALTKGKSRTLSNFLIASEKMSLIPVKMQELKALPFNKKGIDILCTEVISMKKTPAFKSKVSLKNFPKIEKFRRWSVVKLAKDLYGAHKKRDFLMASTLLRKEMKGLEKFPGMYCMHRHVIESMLRASNYGPIHQKNARSLDLDVKELGEVSWNFILSQILTFPLAYQIDKMAFPFQQKGIPIICQDVPYIPEY